MGRPAVWVFAKTGNATDPYAYGGEVYCWIQAVHPAEVQDPARFYFLADTRDYRPMAPGSTYDWPPAAISDGWLNGWGNKIYMGTRHYGYANVLYLDGSVTRDNQWHPFSEWNMGYSSGTLTNQWRCATFSTNIELAHVSTQAHIMPVLMVKGWEHFFDADGLAAR